MSFIKKYNVFFVFASIVLVSAVAYLIYAYNVGVSAQYWLAMSNRDDRFFDFRIHVAFVADPKALYDRAVYYAGCFPPLAYVMYYFFYRIIRIPGFIPEDHDALEQMDFLHTGITYYTILVVFLIYFGLSLYGNRDHIKRRIIFFMCILFSTPIYECLMIGNSVLLVMALLLIAYKLRESESAVVREIALILIAICAGFKIYPAVMGLLYLKEKRFAEALRLTIYGLVLFFAPFAFFGGADAFRMWFSNITLTMGMLDYGRIQCVKEAVNTLLRYVGIMLPTAFYTVLSIVFVLGMILLAWFSKNRNRSVFYLCCIMMFFPTAACRYTLCYMIIPMAIYFFDEVDHDGFRPTRFDYIYSLMYSCVYAIPMIWGIVTGFRQEVYFILTYVEMWLYFCAYLLLVITAVYEIVNLKRTGKTVQA